MSWIFLFLAIFFEILGTTCIKLSQGFSRPLPTLEVICFYFVCFLFLAFAVKKIELGIAYAIWSGLGTAIIAILFAGFKLLFT